MTTLAGQSQLAVSTHSGPGHDADAWDELVEHCPGTDVTQLSTWAQLRAQAGFDCVRIVARSGTDLVGGAQVLIRRVPILGAVGYVPYGPVVVEHLDPDLRTRTQRVLAQALHRLARERLRAMFVQPPEGAEPVAEHLLRLGFRPSAAAIAPDGSVRIDLHEDLTVIRGRFGKRLRSWTNRWADNGVTVRRGGDADLALLLRLMDQAAEHRGYRPLPHRYVATLYRELAERGRAVLFVGEVDGVPVAAELMTGCAGMLRGRLGGFDRSGPGARLSVPAAVQWAMVQWAKEEGYRWFDFGGLEPGTLAALLDGGDTDPASISTIDQPKLTFGGTPYRYPTPVELIEPAILRSAFDLTGRSDLGRRTVAQARELMRGTRAGGQ